MLAEYVIVVIATDAPNLVERILEVIGRAPTLVHRVDSSVPLENIKVTVVINIAIDNQRLEFIMKGIAHISGVYSARAWLKKEFVRDAALLLNKVVLISF
jgi:hypothetical protein